MIAPLSEAALNQYPLAEVFGNIPITVLYGVIALCAVGAFAGGLVSTLNASSLKKTMMLVMPPVAIGLGTGLIAGDLKGAGLFDAPARVVGTVKSVNVMPGGLFAKDAVNVQFADGTGLSFVDAPTIASGATIIEKTMDGTHYYTVQGEGRPTYFRLRNSQ